MENKSIRILEKLTPIQVRQQLSAPNISSLKLNQKLACFLIFLLGILDDEAPSFSNAQESFYAILQKKLSFLHALLGDTPFQCCELENTMNLLIQFETMANEVGSFIYSCVSASTQEMRNRNFDAGIQVLLEKLETFINEKIKAHCIKVLPETATSRTNHLSSLFIIGSLLEDLQGLMDGQFNFINDDIRDLLNTLIKELTFFLSLLKSIEKSQATHTNDPLQDSLITFIDATYEAEYLINAHTAGHIPSWYLNLRIPFVVRKIQIINTRVQNKKIHSATEEKIQALRYPEQDASTVVGFENIRESYLADLVRGSKNLKYISVIGMSGIGKSTMAKKLFNDRAVRNYFGLHVWCTVSKTYDKKKVLDEIWVSLPIRSGKGETLDFESLALRIYQTLMGRKYLIIMDDVWDSRMWDDLKRYFPDNGNGSRILLTSQIKNSAPAGSIIHQLPLLSNSQCHDLLMRKVFIEEPFPSELLDISQRIASKCHRLPLAVVVIAGILANVGRDKSAWRNVERNMDSYISDDSSMRILELSYKYLPNYLKPCFLCVVWSFSTKDIRVRELIPLWISHGFVEKKENKSREDIAQEYLVELINRSLLIITKRRSDGGIKGCELHDLIAEMCGRRAKAEKFYCSVDQFYSLIYMDHPHISFLVEPGNICSISALPARSVSTLISALGHSVAQMPLLRVIKDQKSPIDEKIIGGFVHLRYLSSFARIAKVPEGICNLINLEYLHITAPFKVDATSTILKMVKLRDIFIAPQVVFYQSCDTSQIRNNIKSLSWVRMKNHDDEEILKCSPHLHKLKCICDQGLFPDISSLTLLESLNISAFNSPRLKGELTMMNFPSTLQKVTLSGTNVAWEESSVVGRLPNLQVLKILHNAFCGNEWKTRDGEFQKLRFLKIHNILSLRQWTSCSEHFPILKHLLLDHARVEIPLDYGNISTLQTIEVGGNCGSEVYESADRIRVEQLEYENEHLKVIIRGFDQAAPCNRGEDEKAKMSVELEKEEVSIRKSVQGSSNRKESPARSPQHQSSTPLWICAGCNSGHGTFIIVMRSYWHRECFCCHACKQTIYDAQFRTDSDERTYHDSCYKDLQYPKCDICKDYVRTNADGNYYDYLISKFWDLKYCRSHETDGTPRCCSCWRFEQLDATHLILDDGRALCLECKESLIIMNAEECETLYNGHTRFFPRSKHQR